MSTPAALTEAIGLSELAALACSPAADVVSPFAEFPCLLVRLEKSAPALNAQQEAFVARWMRRQPCPVIAIAEKGVHESLQQACDIATADPATLGAVIENIRRSPLAATVLVQVLRVTEHIPIEQALVVESLGFAALQNGPELRRWLAERTPRNTPKANDAGPAVLVERRGEDLELRLNRPSRRNSMSVEMRDALYEALQLVIADPSIQRVQISGVGKCFSAGGDLDEFGTAPDAATAHAVRSVRLPATALLQCVERVEFRVHGACVGAGAEFPAFGRRVCATRDAFFQLPEIRLGLIPGAGGCVSIPRRIGRQRAAYMALSAERIDASRALSWGLIDAIVDGD
ncbi:MAG: enoyl-CoA hydratase/isomerase family protein [Steroidobacteraceae bacterium]|jgi:enoyl-CoA hydratase/carnithine racemase|nr:enoyl-CoA hydratase/isomerase family protein [Steroidobacteraceae bacterium]